MSNFFGALTTLCLIAFVVGMVKPKFIMQWASESKQNRKWVAIITIVGMVVFSGLANYTMTPEEKVAQQVRQEQQKKDLEAEKQAEADKKVAEEQAVIEKKVTDYNVLYNQVLTTFQPLDNATQARQDIAVTGDLVGLVNKMVVEKEAIATAKANLNNLSAPSSFDNEDKENWEKGKEKLNQALDQRDAFIAHMARFIKNHSETDLEMAKQLSQKSDASMMNGLAHIVIIGQKYNAN